MSEPVPTAGSTDPERFPAHSRYADCAISDDGEHRYLKRRIIASGERATVIAQHLVVAGDQLDLLAQQYYGDPLLSWRIADANGAQDPHELVLEPGRVLRITAADLTGGLG